MDTTTMTGIAGLIADTTLAVPAADFSASAPVGVPATVALSKPTHLPTETDIVGQVRQYIWKAEDGSAQIAKLADGTSVRGPILDEEGLVLHLTYRFIGAWEEHHQHGLQFRFIAAVRVAPHDRLGIVTYLANVCPGVGAKRAAKLWELFSGDAVQVLRNDPQLVVERGVMSAADAEEASQALHDEGAFETTKVDLLSLFAGRGFQASKLIRECLAKWGERAPKLIRDNPYLLMLHKLPSAGFKRCDKLYLDRGGDPRATKRQMLCGWHWLKTDSIGNTWFKADTVGREIADKIPGADPFRALRLGIRAGWLSLRKCPDGSVWIGERRKTTDEANLALSALRLLGPIPGWDAGKQPTWPNVAELPGLYDHQRERLAMATSRRFGLLTGRPGTGKTHSLGVLIAAIVSKYGSGSVAVVAPTGKAAVRVTEALVRARLTTVRATTIHTALEIDRNGHDGDGWNFKRNERNPLDAKFIFCDESSMDDASLLASLLAACAYSSHVLLIGDPNQLPPVGHGCPLRDLIAAGVPNGELTEIHRNAGAIVRTCHAIADDRPWSPAITSRGDRVYAAGIVPSMCAERITAEENLWHFEEKDEKKTAQLTEILALAAAKVYGLENVAVLVPTHKGDLGRKYLNARLQSAFNATGESAPPNPFRVGDPVICLKNGWYFDAYVSRAEKYIANGETGVVLEVTDRACVAKFPRPDRTVKFVVAKSKAKQAAQNDADENGGSGDGDGNGGDDGGPRNDFDIAYVITGHKMQGSQAKVVIVVADPSAGARRVASREWLYTSLSRAEFLCITVGKLSVVQQMGKRPSLVRRKTFLVEILSEFAAAVSSGI